MSSKIEIDFNFEGKIYRLTNDPITPTDREIQKLHHKNFMKKMGGFEPDYLARLKSEWNMATARQRKNCKEYKFLIEKASLNNASWREKLKIVELMDDIGDLTINHVPESVEDIL